MSIQISSKGVASKLVASALASACTGQARAGATAADSFVDTDRIQTLDTLLPQNFAEGVETTGSSSSFVNVRTESAWDEQDTQRFQELVEMIAFEDQLPPALQREYERLKALRRNSHPTRSYGEIIADRELHKRISQAVSSINSLIDYATKPFQTETQSRRS